MIRTVKDKKTAILMAVFFSALLSLFDSAPAQGLEEMDREISNIVDRISGAVVTVEARPREGQAPVFPGQRTTASNAVNTVVGTGLIIDSVGHILTSLRLVDGYDDFRVDIQGRTLNASLIGVDHRHKIAVLKVDSIFYSYIEISSFPPLAGRMALAYGHSIDHTGYPALGIIAGRQSDGSYLVSGSILPGLLGGGVFDLGGKLLGMISSGNVAVNDYRGTWGGMVMLPAGLAIAAADRIICCGNREAGYLGVRTTAIELVSPNQEVLGEAVVVSEVEPGSPAEAAGIRAGDIITRIGVSKITNDRELQRMIGSAGADSTIMIEYMRGQRQMNISISLSSLKNGRTFGNSARLAGKPDNQTLMAIELQRKIDSMRAEMRKLEEQLLRLMGRAGSAR